MPRMLTRCPNCGGDLEATRLSCKSCETVILARYDPCPFCKLSPETQRFIELFVAKRGNLKEMERELGLSYWALRGRLNEVVKELGYESPPPEEEIAEEELTAKRRAILAQLSEGKITAREAAEQLDRLRSSDVAP